MCNATCPSYLEGCRINIFQIYQCFAIELKGPAEVQICAIYTSLPDKWHKNYSAWLHNKPIKVLTIGAFSVCFSFWFFLLVLAKFSSANYLNLELSKTYITMQPFSAVLFLGYYFKACIVKQDRCHDHHAWSRHRESWYHYWLMKLLTAFLVLSWSFLALDKLLIVHTMAKFL